MQKGRSFGRQVQAFDINQEFQYQNTLKSTSRAASFAADLCVVSGDQSLDSVTLEEGQEGLLLDINDKSVMYAKGAYEKVYPASITKIMTALLAFTNGNMDDIVTISEENVTLEEGSQRVGFQVGDQVTMDELVHCLLVYSGNDAAICDRNACRRLNREFCFHDECLCRTAWMHRNTFHKSTWTAG